MAQRIVKITPWERESIRQLQRDIDDASIRLAAVITHVMSNYDIHAGVFQGFVDDDSIRVELPTDA